jgi:hypothetical protein
VGLRLEIGRQLPIATSRIAEPQMAAEARRERQTAAADERKCFIAHGDFHV